MVLPRRRSASFAVCVVAAIVACLPVWLVRYPPVQDLPMHTAALRVIHSFHDLTYGFDSTFVLTIGNTQYLLYYLAGSALAYLLGVHGATVAMMTFYVAGTVLGTASLARALDKSPLVALFAVPLVYNCSFVIGFLPFLIGIPLLLFALAATVRYLEAPTRRRGVVVAVLTILLFYAHVVPFGMFGIGYAALVVYTAFDRTARAARPLHRYAARVVLPMVPAAVLVAHWLFFTEAGKVTLAVATDASEGDPPWPFDKAIREVYTLAFDVFRDTSEETAFLALIALIILALGLAQGDRDRARPLARPLAVLPLVALVLFLRSGHRVGYVAHIKDRFPIVFVFTWVPLLRVPRGVRGAFVGALGLALTAYSTRTTLAHFRAFQDEAAGFDGALAAMAPRHDVASLIFDPSSQVTTQAPYLHFGQYYQVDKGGIVQFTFAGYPHWPFAFQDGQQVPPGEPPGEGWCWAPQGIPVKGALEYFDYVLTRGAGFHPPVSAFRRIYAEGRWEVWQRVR